MSSIKGMDYNHDELYPNTKTVSSSQLLSYEESPNDFYMEYVIGVRRPTSMPMQIGKVFSAMFANRKRKFTKELADLRPTRIAMQLIEGLKQFPNLPSKMCEVALKCSFKGWKFRATLDGLVIKQETIIENKTGMVEWTQQRADTSDQITFQNWCYWKKYKKMADKTLVYWLNTKSNPRQLVYRFETTRTLEQVMEFEKRVEVVISNLEAGNFTQALYR